MTGSGRMKGGSAVQEGGYIHTHRADSHRGMAGTKTTL